MRRVTLVVAIVASVAAAFAGCSLTTDLDDLTRGTADGDSGSSSTDGMVTGEGGDSGASGGDGGDGAGPDACVDTVLCDDFERSVPDGKWANIYTDRGGTVTIDTTTSTSPTRSLALYVPPVGDPHAQLSSVAYPNVTHALVAFSMKCGAPNRTVSLMRLQLNANSRSAVMDLFMFDGRVVIDENVFGMPSGTYADYNLSGGFVANTWQRWTLELDARAKPAVGIVTLDGVERVRTNLQNSFVTGALTVLAGVFYAPDGPAQTIRYDDVAVTILP